MQLRSVACEVAGAIVLVNRICFGKPGEYAALTVHLASEECYHAGSIINVSGGMVI